jgi:ABC-2 type transport system ATP-binding protein
MLMTAVAEEGLSVLLSSHVVAELQRVCDYVVLLAAGQVQLIGDVEEVVAGHRVLTGPVSDADSVAPKLSVVRDSRTERLATLLVRMPEAATVPPGWEVSATNLEEVVLGYLRSPGASALPGPSLTTARSA